MNKINSFFKKIISAIYPNKCICCSEIIDEDFFLCENCNNILERNDPDNFCLSCGFEKNECVCKYNIYRFDCLICVFKNTGYVKDIYYSYKFSKRQHYSKFFAQEMCYTINQCYNDIKFDFICSVPSFKRNSYDHSGYIAKEISNILNIPYANNLLCCIKKTKKQHKSTIKERITNTDGKYSFNYRIDGAKILLVDDIKTTGATIDECAKMLLYAGAENVYCVTALGSSSSKK